MHLSGYFIDLLYTSLDYGKFVIRYIVGPKIPQNKLASLVAEFPDVGIMPSSIEDAMEREKVFRLKEDEYRITVYWYERFVSDGYVTEDEILLATSMRLRNPPLLTSPEFYNMIENPTDSNIRLVLSYIQSLEIFIKEKEIEQESLRYLIGEDD